MTKANSFFLSFVTGAVVIVCGAYFLLTKQEHSLHSAYVPRPPGSVTFSKDIAPVIFRHCASCHRPGQAAPFALLSYADVKKNARTIAKATQSRYMPPWLPEPGHGDFMDERQLSEEDIGLINQWVNEGTAEGDPKDLPPLPTWPDGWQLGKPDLVVQMAEPYTLTAEGKDVYRSFVLPIPITSRQYVQAIELRPSNRTVHHAFIRFDRTKQSRRLDDQDSGPGFNGMRTPASAGGVGGFFLGWQPGKSPSREPEGLSWALEPATDLVLQMHLQPSGKPESIQPSAAFYFTDKPPTRQTFKLGLSTLSIDIPPNEARYAVEDSYTLPVDVEVLAVAPHAHYLGKELQAFALLPNGTKQGLFLIKDWNFDWQGDYRYRLPVFLPKGSKLSMRFTYDNSTNNVRNPFNPPRRVKYGLQSTDEMAEVYLQLLVRNTNDLSALADDYSQRVFRDSIAYNKFLLSSNPDDAKAHNELGKALMALGKSAEALQHFRKSVAAQPDFDEAHYHLGLILEEQKKWNEARKEYEIALRHNPDNFQAHNNLGLLLLKHGYLTLAESHFQAALRINPNDEIVHYNLDLLAKARAAAKKP